MCINVAKVRAIVIDFGMEAVGYRRPVDGDEVLYVRISEKCKPAAMPVRFKDLDEISPRDAGEIRRMGGDNLLLSLLFPRRAVPDEWTERAFELSHLPDACVPA